MTKKRVRRSQARYPQEPLPDLFSVTSVRGPWKTRADRARALRALLPFDPERERECEGTLAAAGAQGIDANHRGEALYTGLVEHYREQVRSQRARQDQELEVRVRRVRRDLPPLL